MRTPRDQITTYTRVLMARLLSLIYALILVAVVGTFAHGLDHADASSSAATAAVNQFQPCPVPEFEAAVQRFSKVLTYKTVSSADAEHHIVDPQEFNALDAYLAQAYAEVTQCSASDSVSQSGSNNSILQLQKCHCC